MLSAFGRNERVQYFQNLITFICPELTLLARRLDQQCHFNSGCYPDPMHADIKVSVGDVISDE
jgi:hypothetical protein